MLLQKLLSGIPAVWKVRIPGSATDIDISSLAYDSRCVEKGSLFFAIEGMITDGHKFLDEALQRGAVAVASERKADAQMNLAWIQVSSIRKFMALCSNEFYGNPSKRMQLVGVTGTNGKTTTCHLIQAIMDQVSPSLKMGTIDAVIGEQRIKSRMTTSEAPDIQRALSIGLQRNCRYGVVEVSSHALILERVFQCCFPVAVFTNLSQDHLDFHNTLEEYFKAKQLLFCPSYNPGLQFVVTNNDDPYGRRLGENSRGETYSFGTSDGSDIQLREYSCTRDGLELNLDFFGRTLKLHSPLVGNHNLYNVMSAATACSLLGIEDGTIQEGIQSVDSVPGRFERVQIDAPFTVFVDFAHTPDALEHALRLATKISQRRVICVFGCGGDRDRGKRAFMGKIAAELADLAIITSDNPRSEDPQGIILEIEKGIPSGSSNFEIVIDREKAIRRALELADAGDLVLLAGKGHEVYQEIQGRRFHFDEREIVKEALCLN
jgi:UDP-N-acetylmuramoyl-L-alanyl-D-glutamate--2,6-diaminopimelate ligase